MLAGAAACATAILYFVFKSEGEYKTVALKASTADIKKLDEKLDDARKSLTDKKEIPHLLKQLESFEEKLLNRDQMRKRLILMGDISLNSYRKEKNSQQKQLFFEAASKYYFRAAEYAAEEGSLEDKNSIIRRIARLSLEHREWAKALKLYEQSSSIHTEPTEQWKIKVEMAECFKQLGQYYNAVQILSQVADDTDDRELWGQAQRIKADILLESLTDKKVEESLASRDAGTKAQKKNTEQEAQPETTPAPEISLNREKIFAGCIELYNDVLNKLPPVSEQTAYARLGLLKIAVMKKDTTESYRQANLMQNSPAPSKFKADALMLMAGLEEELGNTKASVKILETCLVRYPRTNQAVALFMSLYKQYKKLEDWQKAFAMAEKVFVHSDNAHMLNEMMDDLFPDKNPMLSILTSEADYKDDTIKRIKGFFETCRSNNPLIWRQLKNKSDFLMALLYFNAGEYKKSHEQLEYCRANVGNNKDLAERLNYLDLQIAQKSNASPAITLIRAKRYLAGSPEGKYYQEALMATLDSYFDMSLYNEALETSKKIYIDDLMQKKLGKTNPFWLRTVARIGESYQMIGKTDTANTIIKNNYYELLDQPFAPDVFLSWAKDAQKRGQTYEAIRRLDVVIPKTVEASEKAELLVARYLLQLSVGSYKDFENTKQLLDAVTKSQRLTPELKQTLRRKLYEGLLEYSFKTNSADTHRLVDAAVKEFTDEYWPQHWILRSLSSMFASGGLEKLTKSHEETLQLGASLKNQNSETINFLKKQLDLIKNLVAIEESAEKLKVERGL